jgi:hypothetical protein
MSQDFSILSHLDWPVEVHVSGPSTIFQSVSSDLYTVVVTLPYMTNPTVKFFITGSYSQQWQIPQSKDSHLIPQWRFLDINGNRVDDITLTATMSGYRTSAYYESDFANCGSESDPELNWDGAYTGGGFNGGPGGGFPNIIDTTACGLRSRTDNARFSKNFTKLRIPISANNPFFIEFEWFCGGSWAINYPHGISFYIMDDAEYSSSWKQQYGNGNIFTLTDSGLPSSTQVKNVFRGGYAYDLLEAKEFGGIIEAPGYGPQIFPADSNYDPHWMYDPSVAYGSSNAKPLRAYFPNGIPFDGFFVAEVEEGGANTLNYTIKNFVYGTSQAMGPVASGQFSIIDDMPTNPPLTAWVGVDFGEYDLYNGTSYDISGVPGCVNSNIITTLPIDVNPLTPSRIKITREGINDPFSYYWTDICNPYTFTIMGTAPDGREGPMFNIPATNASGPISAGPMHRIVPQLPEDQQEWTPDNSSSYISGGYLKSCACFSETMTSATISACINILSAYDFPAAPNLNYAFEGSYPPIPIYPYINNAEVGYTYIFLYTDDLLVTPLTPIASGTYTGGTFGNLDVFGSSLAFFSTLTAAGFPIDSFGVVAAQALGIPISSTLCSGESEPFDILEYDKYDIRKFNESWQSVDWIKDQVRQNHILLNEFYWDKYSRALWGDASSPEGEGFGRQAYEKIANYTANHADINTCDLKSLYDLALETDVPIDDYSVEFPPELRRIVDLGSINQQQLWGSRCRCSRNITNQYSTYVSGSEVKVTNYKCEICDHYHPGNRGEIFDPQNYSVSAFTPFIVEDRAKNKFHLVIPPLSCDNIYPEQFALSGCEVPTTTSTCVSVYPLSTTYNFLLPIDSSLEFDVAISYFCFYDYVDASCPVQIAGVINWDDPYTTLMETASTNEAWYGDEQNLDKIINYTLHKGLGLIK